MGLFRDLSQLPETAKGGVLVIGNFDGVHKGHQAVLARALEKPEKLTVRQGQKSRFWYLTRIPDNILPRMRLL